MSELSERIRKEEEEQRRRIAEEAQRKEQVNQQFRTRQSELFQALDKIGVRQMLEDMRQDVWKGHGVITEARNEGNRVLRLTYEYSVPADLGYTTRKRQYRGTESNI